MKKERKQNKTEKQTKQIKTKMFFCCCWGVQFILDQTIRLLLLVHYTHMGCFILKWLIKKTKCKAMSECLFHPKGAVWRITPFVSRQATWPMMIWIRVYMDCDHTYFSPKLKQPFRNTAINVWHSGEKMVDLFLKAVKEGTYSCGVI